MGDLTKNFSRYEFACKCGCGADQISIGLVHGLQEARNKYMKVMIINSGVRCEEHNKEVEGRVDSEHLVGEAADIGCSNSMGVDSRWLNCCWTHGFRRIGIDGSFIHIGIETLKSQDVIWVY